MKLPSSSITKAVHPAQLGVGLGLLLWLLFISVCASGQDKPDIFFVSDTQAPMWVEKLFLHANQNEKATRLIMEDIVKQKPNALFILGDVTMLSYKNKKWKDMDRYLLQCREAGIPVAAVLGNHDVMAFASKGQAQFQKRFPQHILTGYFQVVDSIGVVLLNSNFSKMSKEEIQKQQTWLTTTLDGMDHRPDIKTIIVTCHHAPYTNSKIVGCSKEVEQNFVVPFLQSRKCRLFITGHAHAFEHFQKTGRDFLTIGGGGGIHQPLNTSPSRLHDLAEDYKPMFHYLKIKRVKSELTVTSYYLKDDFSGLEKGKTFVISLLL